METPPAQLRSGHPHLVAASRERWVALASLTTTPSPPDRYPTLAGPRAEHAGRPPHQTLVGPAPQWNSVPMERTGHSRTITTVALAAGLLLLLAACAAGANPTVGAAVPGADAPAGFLLGVWHGVILPISWIVSLFTDTVNLYEVHNNGNWYDVGFMVGISMVFGGPFGASRARKK